MSRYACKECGNKGDCHLVVDDYWIKPSHCPYGEKEDVFDMTRAYWQEVPFLPEPGARPYTLAEMARDSKKWVSVTDRLPVLKDANVLAHFTTGSIGLVHIEDYFKDITAGIDPDGKQLYTKWYLTAGVTHWMDLPGTPE